MLILTAYSQDDVKGNAFVVKGEGDIKPAAGRTIYLLDFENRAELFHTSGMAAYTTVTDRIGDELNEVCEEAVEKLVSSRDELFSFE